MLDYSRQFADEFDVVSSPGAGVTRPRIAITSVASKGEDLKAYQVAPAALVATMPPGLRRGPRNG